MAERRRLKAYSDFDGGSSPFSLRRIAAAFVVLLAGIAAATYMTVRASRAEQEARAVSDFLQDDLLSQAGAGSRAGANTKPDPHLEVRTALDRAAGAYLLYVEHRYTLV